MPLSYPVFPQHIIDKLVTKRYKQIQIDTISKVLFQSGWIVETIKVNIYFGKGPWQPSAMQNMRYI